MTSASQASRTPSVPSHMDWSPTSWQSKPAAQQPSYLVRADVDRVVAELSKLPPLVTSWEIESLKSHLAEAAAGRRWLLQGGDCAERFDECESSVIANKLKILLQMSLVLVHGTRKRVIRVGRFAGQYAKPRSADAETRDGKTLLSYRGDLINHPSFTEAARTPDPDRMLRGYERAALTLNFIRSLIDGGFADLHHPEYWDDSRASTPSRGPPTPRPETTRRCPATGGTSSTARASRRRPAGWIPSGCSEATNGPP